MTNASKSELPSRPPSLLSSLLHSSTVRSMTLVADDTENETSGSMNFHDDEEVPPAPSSLLASTLPTSLMPDLFSSNFAIGLNLDGSNASSTPATAAYSISVPPRPRRLWQVQDKLRPVPSYYPPLDTNCTCLVTDVSASLVAVRITECLRKRSIAAEYDEESVTAHCMTVDRMHFTIHMYRGSKSSSDCNDVLLSSGSSPVIVECQRQSGSVTSFHAACYAVLKAAKGNETGFDKRKPQCTNGMEFQTLSPASKRRKLVHSSSSLRSLLLPHQRHSTSSCNSMSRISIPSMAAEAAFEGARELLQKDRLECQVLGMESLVNLTNEEISSQDVCQYVSDRLLRDDWLIDSFLMHPEAEQATSAFKSAKGGFKSRRDRNEGDQGATTTLIRSFLESSAAMNSSRRFQVATDEDRNPTAISSISESQSEEPSPEECSHEAKLRSLALRVLCNALYTLNQSGQLQHILGNGNFYWDKKEQRESSKRNFGISNSHSLDEEKRLSRLIQPPFLLSLVQDMQGATRPPSVSELGFKLASAHEAALAIRCLRLLAGTHGNENGTLSALSPQARVRDFLRNEVILESLEIARSCGRATHDILQQEADRTYTQVTEDARSC